MNPGGQAEYMRRRVLRGLRIYFANRRWPRLIMSGVLAFAGGIGFLSSVAMLHARLEKMWLRYPLAVLVGWAAFLGLIRLWAALEARVVIADEEMEALCRTASDPGDGPEHGETFSTLCRHWFDVLSHAAPDGAEGCLIWIVVFGALLLVTLAGIYCVVIGAPVLIAEVFLDAILVTALYKRMAQLDRRWWLTGALERTAAPVLWTVLTLGLAGAAMHQIAPEAKSIGGFIRHIRAP